MTRKGLPSVFPEGNEQLSSLVSVPSRRGRGTDVEHVHHVTGASLPHEPVFAATRRLLLVVWCSFASNFTLTMTEWELLQLSTKLVDTTPLQHSEVPVSHDDHVVEVSDVSSA